MLAFLAGLLKGERWYIRYGVAFLVLTFIAGMTWKGLSKDIETVIKKNVEQDIEISEVKQDAKDDRKLLVKIGNDVAEIKGILRRR